MVDESNTSKPQKLLRKGLSWLGDKLKCALARVRLRHVVATLLTLLFLVGVWALGFDWSGLSLRLLGFWLVVASLLAGTICGVFFLLRRMVGPPWTYWVGDRELSIVVALLIAAALFSGPAMDLQKLAAGLARGLLVQSPYLVAEAARAGETARAARWEADAAEQAAANAARRAVTAGAVAFSTPTDASAALTAIVTVERTRTSAASATLAADIAAEKVRVANGDLLMVDLYACIVDERRCLGGREAAKEAKETAKPQEAQASAAGSAADPSPASPRLPPPKLPSADPDWLFFLIALFGLIMMARGLRGARKDYFMRPRRNVEAAAEQPSAAGQGHDAAPPDGVATCGGEPPEAPLPRPSGRRQVLMDYPTWVAFCIYALILVPATYLAIGSLLYLRLDAPAADVVALGRSMDELERQHALPPLELTRIKAGFERLKSDSAGTNATPPAGMTKATFDDLRLLVSNAGLELVKDASRQQDGIATTRAAYKSKVMKLAGDAKYLAPTSQFGDATAAQTARFEGLLREAAEMQQSCRGVLAAVLAQQEVVSVELNKPSAGGLNLEPLQKAVDGARDLCGRALKFKPPFDWLHPEPCEEGQTCVRTPKAEFPGVLYGWLASTSDAAVLIVGLMGFGLFGSAIRMMGRADTPTVTDEDILAARTLADVALRDVCVPADRRQRAKEAKEKAQAAADEACATFKARAASDPSETLDEAAKTRAATEEAAAQTAMTDAQGRLREAAAEYVKADGAWREAELKAKAAEAKYDQTLRDLIENRSSIVVKDPEAKGHDEYIISGAPAKVMVQGLGAAFTTFLAGQASVQILSTGGQVNAFSTLLACFIGAVFAEEIWKQARKWLPNGAGAPAAATCEEKKGDQKSAANAANG